MSRLSDKSIEVHYLELFDELKLKIASESDDFIIIQSTDDLVKYYLINPFRQLNLTLIKRSQ